MDDVAAGIDCQTEHLVRVSYARQSTAGNVEDVDSVVRAEVGAGAVGVDGDGPVTPAPAKLRLDRIGSRVENRNARAPGPRHHDFRHGAYATGR